jgi:tRNA A-37 threonylcarbamoyl transferase component Bud32
MSRRSEEPGGQGFALDGWTGRLAGGLEVPDLDGEVRRLADPGAALETLHWGRNYIYRAELHTAGGTLAVAVKQFRPQGWADRLRRRLRGSKAWRSWQAACVFQQAGIPTAAPLLLLESVRPDGPSLFVAEHLAGVTESRYVFRAVEEGSLSERFPWLDYEGFLRQLGSLLRRMHEAGCWHRDLSIGNVLLQRPAAGSGPAVPELFLIDLNRARLGRQPTVSERTRDLCRLRIFEPAHQELFLRAYWGQDDPRFAWKRSLYRRYHQGFLKKVAAKGKVRGGLRGLRDRFRVRRAHAHIPAAPAGAAARDKIVWDPLSDQPHQHASRLEKAAIRLSDLRGHGATAQAITRALPAIWSRYRSLKAQLYREPLLFGGLGLGLRPCPQAPEALLEAVEELGVKRLLLRLHPWEARQDDEEALAQELCRRGYELAFALPQNRALVTDPARWRAAVEELGARFSPYGRHFQIGQAINRSKWGLWNYREYCRLAGVAAEALGVHAGVELLGPAVIDFEFHATAAVLNLASMPVDFDVVSALLYVDRRGAPENRQAGLDTVDKTLLLRAIAETARHGSRRCWITEFNWPLWEGPHSPAGRDVSVDEDSQANYLLRYLLLTLGTGAVERAYWWQLVARGYGLTTLEAAGGLRRRPSFHTLAMAARTLQGATFSGPLESPEGTYLYPFHGADGSPFLVGWTVSATTRVALPAPARRILSRDGAELSTDPSSQAALGPDPRYFFLEADN